MKKKLCRIIVLVGLAAMMTVGFAGCKKTTCEWCGEEGYCKPMYLNMLGEYSMCKDCREVVAPISENYKELEEMYGN
ncbi:MAG: hypothetical protein IJX95_12020 [Lachnospiraceae bacterium]|nr:hypothetical protein [Lachnospiraceae bacterium]